MSCLLRQDCEAFLPTQPILRRKIGRGEQDPQGFLPTQPRGLRKRGFFDEFLYAGDGHNVNNLTTQHRCRTHRVVFMV